MRFPRFRVLEIAILCLALSQIVNVRAETATDWARTDQSGFRLISERDGVKGLGSVRIGLQIKLAPGWKTYWRSPGDSGIPPRFDWTGSRNVKDAVVLWPLPDLFETYGLFSWGYHDEVVFPIDIALAEPGKPVDLKLSLQIGICENVCIPVTHEFALSLGPGSAELSSEAAVIQEFVRRVPRAIGAAGAVLRDVTAAADSDNVFTVTAQADQPFNAPEIIVEGKDGSYFELVSKKLSPDGLKAYFTLRGYLPGKDERMTAQTVTVTVFDDLFSGEKSLRVE